MRSPDFEKGVFRGDQSIKDFLNPENHPPVPLVELSRDLNPLRDDGVRIYAKLLTYLPRGNVKSGTSHELVCDVDEKRNGDPINTLVENSSGNTGGTMAVIAPHFGIPETQVYVSPDINDQKVRLLQMDGAKVVKTKGGIAKARDRGEREGFVNPGQYHNESNPEFFRRVIGPQIWDQTDGEIMVFCAGLGSTGTMVGTSAFLKSKNPDIATIGVIVREGDKVPGVRTRERLLEISHPWQDAVDRTVEISAYDSYRQSLALIRTGINAGPSSGFALHGLLTEIEDMRINDELDPYRNREGEITTVFMIPDTHHPYIDDYFDILGQEYFPPVVEE